MIGAPMLFNSFPFFVLITITFTLYYLPPLVHYQRLLLLISSLFFYSWSAPYLLLLLLLSIGVNAVSSFYIANGNQSHRLRWASFGVITNLSILIFFKYSGLLYKTFWSNPTQTDSLGHFLLTLPLPIGISFYTFQGISVVVDTYRQSKQNKQLFQIEHNFKSHLFTIAFFKSFFPQLVSGPIVKAHEFLPQISLKRFSSIPWEAAFRALVTGYFLKMVIADQLKDQTFWITPSFFDNCSTLTLLMLIFGYSMQIFADFAGYSLIAIGTARLFGYELPQNFRYPYLSKSFSEFWTRWHISLSSFLREYLYFPLGGNQLGKFRTYLNLFLVMLLGGIWHGAAWSYAVWGVWHGGLLVVERLIGQNSPSENEPIYLKALRSGTVFSFVTLGWLLFRLPHFEDAIDFIKCLFSNHHLPHNKMIIFNVFIFSIPVVGHHFVSLIKSKMSPFVTAILYGIMIFLILTNSGAPGEFIYFQF